MKRKKKEEYSTTSQKPPVLDLNLFIEGMEGLS